MHVIAHRLEIAVTAAIHDQGLVATAEQMPEQPVSSVEPGGVGAQQSFHPSHQVAPWRLHHQMEVIVHQTERMHLPTGLSAGLPQGIQETLAISVVPKYHFPAVAPVHHVVDRARILDPQLARRRPQGPDTRSIVNCRD